MTKLANRLVVLCALLSGVFILPMRAEPPAGGVSQFITGDATVRFQNFEGGFYSLETRDGRQYDPLNTLPPEFRAEGVTVRFEGNLRTDVFTFHQFGQVVEITRIQKLNFYAGSYAGTVRREAAGGQGQTGDTRFGVSEDGSIFGIFNLPGESAYIRFQGSVDQNGRGTVKTRLADEAGRLSPDPDAEKMPILFFRDGRVVAGSLNAQGVSLTLRASFTPVTFLPVATPSSP